MKYAVGLILGLALVVSFQNCAETKFSQVPSGTVVASATDTNSPAMDPALSPTDPTGPTNPTGPTDPTGPTNPTDPTDPRSPTSMPDPTASPSPSPIHADGPHNFVCVLAGPGKSTKLAYLDDDQLEGKTGTPSDICMSEKACTEIVSQKFSVQGPSQRGFCPDKNPHVIEFSDAQVADLVAKVQH